MGWIPDWGSSLDIASCWAISQTNTERLTPGAGARHVQRNPKPVWFREGTFS
jgi:hypothetical protein